MHILDVVPITKSINKETLSYFSVKAVTAGSLVSVPVRKKIIPALVVNTYDVSNLKGELKSSAFKLRNIHHIYDDCIIPASFITACSYTARYFVTYPGAICDRMIPRILLDEFIDQKKPQINKPKTNQGLKIEKSALQLPLGKRHEHYETLIREHLSRQESIFFCFPTVALCDQFAASLSSQWQARTMVLHSKKTKKNVRETITNMIEHQQPQILCGTAPFLSAPIHNLGRIVVEYAGSPHYRSMNEPTIDQRIFIEKFCEQSYVPILLADALLSFDTLSHIENRDIYPKERLSFRFDEDLTVTHIVRKTTKDTPDIKKQPFTTILPGTQKIITDSLKKKQKIAIYATRTGYASQTICQDCGQSVLCDECESPMVLHSKKDTENVYHCHHCNHKQKITNMCVDCGGHRFTMLGITVDRITEDINKLFPDVQTYIIDNVHTPSDKKSRDMYTSYIKDDTGILIGTQKALSFITEPTDTMIVSSLGSLLSIPHYRSHEDATYVLHHLNQYTSDSLIVQSMHDASPIQPIFDQSSKSIYEQEMILRKQLTYPPFCVLVSLMTHISPTDDAYKKLQQSYAYYFGDLLTAVYKGKKTKGKQAIQAILKVPKKQWIQDANAPRAEETLIDKLYELRSPSRTFHISIDDIPRI